MDWTFLTVRSLELPYLFDQFCCAFQILQVLVQGLKAEEEKRRVQSQRRWKLQLGKVTVPFGQKSTAGRDEFKRGVDSLRLRATSKPNHLKIAKCITRM